MNSKLLDLLARPLALNPTRLAPLLAAMEEGEEVKWRLKVDVGEDGINTVEASGPIGRDGLPPLALAEAVEAAAQGANAVVLALDSPGGGVDDVGVAAERIAAVKVPVVVHTSGLLCSAAYWLASGANCIVAGPTAEVGSIGVYCPMLDMTGLFGMFGLKVELAKTGELKGAGFPGTPWSDAQKANVQEMVEDIFADFKGAVDAYRPGVPDEAKTGGAYMAARAYSMGLVDELGGRDTAMELAALLAAAKQK